ncbi:hypothetical protein EDD22DRAFT_852533 [Suillus occidentalis]|nr:hypothetical protein EDD22DRAFT_852533 [Suillus occidentalis]
MSLGVSTVLGPYSGVLHGTIMVFLLQQTVLNYNVAKLLKNATHRTTIFSVMGDPVTKLSKNLSSCMDELLWNSSPFQLSSDRKCDHKLLQKTKMRLWNMWQDVQLTSSGISVKETEISKIELSWAVVSIAYAVVNSLQADWDVNCFADKAKASLNPLNSDGQQREKLAKYFKTPSFGHISELTTPIDMHRKILA